MSTIRIYHPDDTTAWIPVAIEQDTVRMSLGPRAFLPLNGRTEFYTYGYKSAPRRARYFTALAEIQRAWLDDTSRVFKGDTQWLARWRHPTLTSGDPLLSPRKGWVRVKVSDLKYPWTLTCDQLGAALDASTPHHETGVRFAELT